jgi:hypothetical protein
VVVLILGWGGMGETRVDFFSSSTGTELASGLGLVDSGYGARLAPWLVIGLALAWAGPPGVACTPRSQSHRVLICFGLLPSLVSGSFCLRFLPGPRALRLLRCSSVPGSLRPHSLSPTKPTQIINNPHSDSLRYSDQHHLSINKMGHSLF